MKRNLIFATLSLLCCSAWADTVPGMIVTQKDGTKVNIGMAGLQSIKFENGLMLINRTGEAQLFLEVDKIATLLFGDITSAIEALISPDETQVTITDLSGNLIYKGVRNETPRDIKGIVIMNGKKITIQ